MTKERKKETKPRLKYNKKAMQWVVAKTGEPQDPPMPSWAVKSSGDIPFSKFIREWVKADELEDVHKKFWWKSPAQLKRQRSKINDWFEEHDDLVVHLRPLPDGSLRRKRWGRELKKLIADGIVERKSETGTSTIDRTGLSKYQPGIDLHNELQAKAEAKEKAEKGS